jgi:hypothetical protein
MKHSAGTCVTFTLLALLLAACVPLSTPPAPGGAETAGPGGTATVSPSPTPQVLSEASPPVSPSPSARVPLKDAVAAGMDPQDVWQNFYDLTQIPRPSHHEEQVRDFLVQFGQGLGLETIVDDAGNVLIRKPAAKGMEDRQGVVLQAHMDMVAQPQDGTHDFLTEPIDAYVDGDWVKAPPLAPMMESG